MATVVIPLILVFVSTSFGYQVIQSNVTKVNLGKDDGKSSLAFVFDTTRSMVDDLRQLREGAEMILNTALKDSSIISNFIFAPFNDPVVGPATVTKDKRVFKSALNMVRLQGGGDCPEKSLGGIQLALNISLPRSFIYVFTDATASDHKLVSQVLDLVQRKQSQVVFVLTGDCNDLHKPSYKVYQQIAAASSGQIFNLNKTSVHKVLDFVKTSIKARTVNLASAVRPAGYNYTQEIQVDKMIGEVTVSVSGSKPQIEVVNPSGEKVTGPPQLVTTLDLSEIMIVKVLDPEPGNWSITVGSEQDYSVKVVGLSNLTFHHGFSVETPSSMTETSHRPLQGTYNHLMISLSNPNVPVQIDFAEVLDLTGKTVFEVPLREVDERKAYRADAFIPPDDFFYVAINGHDENGQGFRRIASTAVQSKAPDAPFLIVPQKIKARYHEQVLLSCAVDSLVPVRAMWTKNGKRIMEEINALQSTTVQYVIGDMQESDVGIYRCVAENVAGVNKAPTKLELSVDPPQVTISPANTTVTVDSQLTIVCEVVSEAPLHKSQIIFSSIERQNLTEFTLERAADGFYSYNMSVRAEERAGGKYTCVAANNGGQSKQSTYVTVQLRPVVQILGPHSLTKLMHSDVQFVCHVENCDRVRWVAPGDVIVQDSDVNGSDNSVLDVRNVTTGGMWKCVAMRHSYQANDSIELVVLMKPSVRIEGERNITVVNGTVYHVTCMVVAKPPPRILWHRETEAFLNHTVTMLENNTYKSVLTLDSSKETINATYFCFGENSEGIDQDSITVGVRRKMVLMEGFTDKSVDLYSQVSLHCRVDCHPPGAMRWQHNGTTVPTDHLSEDHSVLHIQKVDFQHLGMYTCVVNNGFEELQVNGSLNVSGLESPVLFKEPSKQKVKKGEAAVLTCRVLKGNPKPTITWSFKNESSVNYTEIRVRAAVHERASETEIARTDVGKNASEMKIPQIDVRSGASEMEIPLAHVGNGASEIEIPSVDVGNAGQYRCVATNVIGQDVYDVELVVQFPPEMSPTNESHLEALIPIKTGEKNVLSCKAEGLPPPIVTWTKFGMPISFTNNVHITDNNELVIEAATDYDSGVYTCKVSNALGTEQRNFTLTVYSAPAIASPGIEPEVQAVEGELVELPCVTSGSPPPQVYWLQNGVVLTERRKYVDDYGLRFVANLTDFGEYTCVAANQYGNASMTYSVFVWVPPHISGVLQERRTVLLGADVTLTCDAVGFPVPVIMWEFNGELLTANTSTIQFNDIGNLVIKNASGVHSGLYACVADNMVGRHAKYTALNVHVPPSILEDNYSGPYIATDMDSALYIPCKVRGTPRPLVLWSHDGRYLDADARFDTDAEGTLMIKYPSVEQSGDYTCVAINTAGNDTRTFTVQIYPFLTGMQGEESRSSVTLVEGAPAGLQCPLPATTNTTLKWYKDAVLISNGPLTFSNVSRQNASTYACVVANVLSSAYANVDVSVQWAPRFIDNVTENVEVAKGDDFYFDCRVDAKPRAKVKWYFNSQVMLGADKEVLKLMTVQLHRTGTYRCELHNEHGTATRRFTLDVLVPPTISEFDVLDVQLKEGSSASLECDAKGSPAPDIKWTFNNTHWSQVNSTLVSSLVSTDSGGLYRCEARNKAGVARLVYRVDVVSPAAVEGMRATRGGVVDVVQDVVEVALGSDIRIACQAKGTPIPIIRWTKHGNTISENDKGISYADLLLESVNASNAGVYSCIASNEGGVDERKVKVDVLEPPRILQSLFQTVNSSDNVITVEVVSGQPVYLHCHPSGTPAPAVYWFKDDVPLRLFDNTMVSTDYGETLVASAASYEQSGNYTCVARNKVGNTSVVYLVDVLVPPPQLKDSVRPVSVRAGRPLNVTCPATGRPLPDVTWLKQPYTEISEQLPRVTLLNDNYTLIINATVPSDSGKYSCVVTNKVGTTEVVFDVTVGRPPTIAGEGTVEHHVVHLRRSLVLKCDVEGYPTPKISWLKDVQPLNEQSSVRALGNSLVALWAVRAHDAGTYICVAENDEGSALRRYHVQVQVPGKWSAWSQWGYCNVTCGSGHQARTRYCHYIDDDNNTIDNSTKSDTLVLDESSCKGPTVDRRKCHMPSCQEEGVSRWSPWSRWGPCSATCGAGTQARSRRCRGASSCVGDNVQIRKCPDLPKCGDYGYSDNTESNELLVSRENRGIDSDPYSPEAAFETQAEVVDTPAAPDQDGYDTPVSYPQQMYYDVNVTSNLDHSVRGRCPPGYTHRPDDSCHDIDECTVEINECHTTQVCVNTLGGYRCTCPTGYMSLGVGQRCLDVNECEVGVAWCQYACVNVAGGYVCACPRHLRLHVDRHHCVQPALYRTPLSFEDGYTEEYLSASLEHPARYTKMTRQ